MSVTWSRCEIKSTKQCTDLQFSFETKNRKVYKISNFCIKKHYNVYKENNCSKKERAGHRGISNWQFGFFRSIHSYNDQVIFTCFKYFSWITKFTKLMLQKMLMNFVIAFFSVRSIHLLEVYFMTFLGLMVSQFSFFNHNIFSFSHVFLHQSYTRICHPSKHVKFQKP